MIQGRLSSGDSSIRKDKKNYAPGGPILPEDDDPLARQRPGSMGRGSFAMPGGPKGERRP